jgi:hypothetical protein
MSEQSPRQVEFEKRFHELCAQSNEGATVGQVAAVVEIFGEQIRKLDAKLGKLILHEARIAELEANLFEYAGVWRDGEYRRGQFVTHQGGIFHCNERTTARPGTNKQWQLAVKSGRS